MGNQNGVLQNSNFFTIQARHKKLLEQVDIQER